MVHTFYGEALGDLKAGGRAAQHAPQKPRNSGEAEDLQPASLASADYPSQEGVEREPAATRQQ